MMSDNIIIKLCKISRNMNWLNITKEKPFLIKEGAKNLQV